jgi:hypothetical protein
LAASAPPRSPIAHPTATSFYGDTLLMGTNMTQVEQRRDAEDNGP